MLSSPERWKKIETLFYQAAEMAPETRSTFLDESCAEDLDLRKEVETLLDSAEKPLDFLHAPVLHAAYEMVAEPISTGISPGTRLDHYEIISLLGAGGMGQVYLAQDNRLRRRAALKVLRAELTHDERTLSRFEHEAQAASALNHPNILTIYEFGLADGLHFIASEFVEGPTLRQKLSSGRLDLNTIIDITIQIASALAAAHSSGIVHRDIKPENVMVRGDGLVKVLDFGIAKLTEAWTVTTSHRHAPTGAASSTQAGLVMGTAAYMSPEQARGQVVDSRSDIFSLGAVLYEMVAGRPAFEGGTVSDVIAEILKGEPPPLGQSAARAPSGLEAVIGEALRKDREARYQSAQDLLADLRECRKEADSGGAHATPPRGRFEPKTAPSDDARVGTAPEFLSSYSVRARWLTGLLLVALLIAGYWTLVLRKSPTRASPGPRSLAILPFRNLKQDPETDFLGFSLADAVITKMAYISALTVRPSTSVDRYRNQIIDPRRVAAELNVDTLLTGSFVKEGDDLRITTQLIDVKPDKILWRDSIDLKYDKLLTVQDRVSQQIIKGLELNLSSNEAQNLKPETQIDSLAYEDYLRGVDLYSLNDFQAAIDMLEKSTSIEPSYAPAWAYLGRAYATNASLHFGGREQYDKAQAAFEKAIALNPALAEPRIYMANLLTDTGRVEQVVPLLRTALQSSPNNAEAHWELGYAYRFGGMLRESVVECERARQYNPQVKINSSALNSYLYLGEYDKFMQSLPVNDSAYILFYHGFGEYYLKHREQAARDFDRAFELDPSLLPASVGKALSYSIVHQNSSGLKLLRQTENKIEALGVSDAELIYKVAQAYAVLGDKAAALHMLRHSIDGGFFCYPYFISDPLLDGIRNEPEFQPLLSQARERHEQFKARFF